VLTLASLVAQQRIETILFVVEQPKEPRQIQSPSKVLCAEAVLSLASLAARQPIETILFVAEQPKESK
jgi:hypothetical protein